MSRIDLQQRLAYLELNGGDIENLRHLGPVLEKHADRFVAAFYRHMLAFEPTRQMLTDPAVKARLLAEQRRYLLSLAGPTLDDGYLEQRAEIGRAHARIGLEPSWYLGAYSLYLRLLIPVIQEAFFNDRSQAARATLSLIKLLTLDAQIGVESYIDRISRTLDTPSD